MKVKYYVLAEFVNLYSVAIRDSVCKKTVIDGNSNARPVDMPISYFQKGDKLELDLSILDDLAISHLCLQEKIGSIVRCDTNYNQILSKQGIDIDLHKTLLENKTVYVNETIASLEMDKFCKNWQSEKAFILNPIYLRYYDTFIDQFYLKQIKTNSKK